MPQPQSGPKPIREGGRWRHAKPSSEEVAEWFGSVPLDEGMNHADYVSGVVIIPASEKVKKPRADGRGTEEVWEQTFTPYTRVDTRIAYFRALAALTEQVAVIEPVEVPRIGEGAFRNDNMPPGFWWHITGEQASAERFLCCTMRVALYPADAWFDVQPKIVQHASQEAGRQQMTAWTLPRPLREGTATKQVSGKPDINGLAKAETGAVGRALGMAGILVVGTGIATAEDMSELRSEAGAPVEVELPTEDDEAVLSARLLELQGQLRQHPAAWEEFAVWWKERAAQGGWQNAMSDPPIEVRRGIASKMEALLASAQDSSPAAADDDGIELERSP